MTIALAVVVPVLALCAGYVIGLACRDAARVDTAAQSYDALQAVHHEHTGLTRATRQAVIDAITAHEEVLPPIRHREALRAALVAAAERRKTQR